MLNTWTIYLCQSKDLTHHQAYLLPESSLKKQLSEKVSSGRRKTTSTTDSSSNTRSTKKRAFFRGKGKSIEAFNIQKADQPYLPAIQSKPFNPNQLTYNGVINKNDSKFSTSLKMFNDVLKDRPKPSTSDSGIAEEWELDGHRNQCFSLKTAHPDGTITESQDPMTELQDTVNRLSPDDSEALMLRLSSLCTQIYFNPLASLLNDATIEALGSYGFCTLPPDHEEQCVLKCTDKTIEAHMLIHSDKIKIFPNQGDDPFDIPCPFTAKAVLTIPVDEPDNCSIKALKLSIGEPISVKPNTGS